MSTGEKSKKMKCLVAFALCFVDAMASIPDGYAHGRYAFYGRYADKCGHDGFYYKNDYKFVICSNGNAYEQSCAPGSRNSGFDKYHHGNHYYYRDFCDVNLVDYGAGISHGYGHHGAGYGYGHDGGYGHVHDASYGFDNDDAYAKGYNSGYGHGSH